MSIPRSEHHDAAIELQCPRCGAKPRFACESLRGRIQSTPHAERLSLAAGNPGTVRAEHPGVRQFQQRFADPMIRDARPQTMRAKFHR
jgi:hypothetical protein